LTKDIQGVDIGAIAYPVTAVMSTVHDPELKLVQFNQAVYVIDRSFAIAPHCANGCSVFLELSLSPAPALVPHVHAIE